MEELTERQRRILGFMGRGMTNSQIAFQFQISEQQLTTFMDRIKQQTGLQTRTELEQLGRSIIDAEKRMN